MSNQSAGSAPTSEFRDLSWRASHRSALTIMWFVTTVTIVAMLWHDVRSTGLYSVARYALQGVYVSVLLWYLCRTGPPTSQLPDLPSLVLRRWRYGSLLPALGVALLFALTVFSDQGVAYLGLLLIIATGWILVVRRRQIHLRLVVLGLAVALIAFLGGVLFWINGFIGEILFFVLLIPVPFMFVAGGLLVARTGLGGVQLLAGGYGKALQSFLWGSLLFVPLGLTNAATGAPGTGMTWVTRWWMPLSLPWFSGIAEEVWFRLLLVGLCYLMLRPALRKYPALAVLAAVLFSGITFGLGHGRTLDNLLTTGLLYGLPMAVVFAGRDWEHAVGAHYVINMIPTVMVFLET